MTIDPWEHTLLSIEPAYHTWKDIMERGPNICIDIRGNVNQRSLMHIVERWPNDESVTTMSIGIKLDERVEWACEQLVSWPDCYQVAWDRWEFEHRRDAEKFKTLFMLKWDQ